MRIADLNGKKILMLGYGREGKAMEQAIKKHKVTCSFTVSEKYPDLQVMGMDIFGIYAGQRKYLDPLSSFDVIIKSPGIPPNEELESLGAKVTSSTQIFLDSIQNTGATVIGVTGSKGKSTTSTLIYEILKAGDKDVSLVGNIGEPAISHMDEAKPGKFFVMEMSSYQLMNLQTSPHIAVITSFFPEHLDYHGSLENYKNAKKNIAKYLEPQDAIFFNENSEGAIEIAQESKGERIPFSADDCPIPIAETKLLGNHNRSNIAAAYAVGEHCGVSADVMQTVIRNFQGLPHRLQSLGMHHGIEWIDDAISTTPESTIAALDALGDRVATIILGGQDRGNDFTQLAQRIKQSSVKIVILFPGTGPRIQEALTQANVAATIKDAQSMEDAVNIARKQTSTQKPGNQQPPIVLLSTASPSYNMFKNFEEKGERFRECILR